MTPRFGSFTRLALINCLVLAGCSKAQRITAPNTVPVTPAHGGIAAEPTRADAPQALQFTPGSTHPYFPLVPGTAFHYRSKTPDGIETGDFFVTDKTKNIQGVTTRVIEDIVKLDGVEIEHTFDWFAQDELGNVWYFGEDATSIDPETGEISHEGSWQAGQHGAQAGIIMLAHPAECPHKDKEKDRDEGHKGRAKSAPTDSTRGGKPTTRAPEGAGARRLWRSPRLPKPRPDPSSRSPP